MARFSRVVQPFFIGVPIKIHYSHATVNKFNRKHLAEFSDAIAHPLAISICRDDMRARCRCVSFR